MYILSLSNIGITNYRFYQWNNFITSDSSVHFDFNLNSIFESKTGVFSYSFFFKIRIIRINIFLINLSFYSININRVQVSKTSKKWWMWIVMVPLTFPIIPSFPFIILFLSYSLSFYLFIQLAGFKVLKFLHIQAILLKSINK